MNHKSIDQVRENVISRIQILTDAHEALGDSLSAVESAGSQIESAWRDWGTGTATHDIYTGKRRRGCDALHTLTSLVVDALVSDIMAAVEQAAFLVARDVIAPVARDSSMPVVALTGNSYMPPIRDLPDAEAIFQCFDPDGDLWDRFIEVLERKLGEEAVMMESPDYDNMLYVVDLSRWTLVKGYTDDDDDNHAWLDNDNWTAIQD